MDTLLFRMAIAKHVPMAVQSVMILILFILIILYALNAMMCIIISIPHIAQGAFLIAIDAPKPMIALNVKLDTNSFLENAAQTVVPQNIRISITMDVFPHVLLLHIHAIPQGSV
jgi:hypothetical protein